LPLTETRLKSESRKKFKLTIVQRHNNRKVMQVWSDGEITPDRYWWVTKVLRILLKLLVHTLHYTCIPHRRLSGV